MKKKNLGIAILITFLIHSIFSLLILVMPEKVYAAVPAPVYLLPFNFDFYDYSHNDKHGVPGATATIVTDPTRGKVLNLNGTANTSVVTIVNSLPSSYTKAAWVKFGTAISGSYSILSNGSTPSSSPDFFWVSTNAFGGSGSLGLKAGPITTTNNAVWSTGAFPINIWTHVAVSYDAPTKQYRLYQSGALIAIGTGTTSSPASTAQAVGAYATSPSANTFNWTGQIDDVYLWDSVLTDGQIAEVMTQNNGDGVTPALPAFPTSFSVSPLTTNSLYLNWTGVGANPVVTDYQIEYKPTTGSISDWVVFTDGVSTATTGLITGLINYMSYDFRISAINASGTGLPSTVASGLVTPFPEPQFLLRFEDTYEDVSSHANHGMNVGAVAIVEDGIRGKVARFNGVIGNYVTVNTSLGTTGFTKAAWVFVPVGTSMASRNIISNSPYGGSNSNFLWINTKLQVGHFSGAGSAIFAEDPSNFASGVWTHVAVTYEPTLKKYMLYKNGALLSSGTSVQNPNTSTGTIIGAFNTTALTFSGLLDDVEMWNSALSSAQIQLVYQGNLGVSVGVPNAPLNLTGTSASANRVSLSRSGVTAILPVTDYQIEYKISTGSTWTTYSDGVGTGSSTTLSGLTTNLSYDFRVSAVNSAGTGTASSVISVTPIVVSVPEPKFLIGFEGNYEDMSIYRNNGVPVGTVPLVVDGTRGKVVNINGSVGNYVGLNVPLNVSGFTKAAWVYIVPGTTLAARNILSNGTYGGSTSSFIVLENGVLKIGHFSGLSQVNVVSDSVAIVSGQWVHVAATYDSAIKKYMLYKNGVLVGSGTSFNDPLPSTGTAIGAFNVTAVTWSGFIDNAEMWDSTLTSLQIQAIYEGNVGVPEDVPHIPLNFYSPSVNTGIVNLSWSGVMSILPVTDYQIEYKISTGSTWTVFSDGVSTGTTVAITGLTNNLSYDFRVAGVNAAGTGTKSIVATAMPGLFIFYHVLSNGQSISVGYGSVPALSVRQPYNNLALGGGDPFSSGGILGPLVEAGVESPSAGLANSLRAYSGNLSRPVIVGLHGLGATFYSDIKKGTAQYAKGMAQASLTKSLVEGMGGVYRPLAVTIEHGEFDAWVGNFLQYEGYLVEWQRDYQFDINALMGTTGVIFPMFLDQEQSSRTGGVAVSQLNAHKNNPGKIFLVGPKYQYPYLSDKLHLTSTGSKFLGEMLAKVINKVAIKGETWNPLMPTSVIRSGGNTILVSFNIPVGTLNIDTGAVAMRPNYGFEYFQSGGSTTTISGVRLLSGNTMVEIALSGASNGTGQRLRYAWTCGLPMVTGDRGHCSDASSGLFVGGNIRDADNSVSPSTDGTGLPLYNRLVTFDESIVTPTVPNAPTNVSATATSGQAIVSFSGSTNSGGAAITEYVVISSPGSITFTGTGSPIVVSGLTNGISYTFTVAAKNYVGTGTSSIASNAVIPAALANAPTNVVAVASSGQAVVSFSGSTYSGGSNILYYIATSSPGNITFTGTGNPITVTGLTNGVSYTFTVAARSAVGTGELSIASNTVVPVSIPNAPTNVAAVASSGQAVVSFSGSTYSGGSNILYYIATSSPGNITFTGTGNPITVTGLTNGVSYTFTVAALTAVGTGIVSSASDTVTPITLANAPTNVSATASSGQATISFSGSTYTGGSHILYYIATSSPGNITYTGIGTPIVVSGLTNGVSYTFTVAALNGAGTGDLSSVSNAVIPATIPNAPTNIVATASSGQAVVSFSGSTYSGGSAIIEYIVSSSTGLFILTGTGSPLTVSGLTNGISYAFTVAARNSIGTGTSGFSNAVIPATVPTEPTSVVATGSSGQAMVSFVAPANSGGAVITEYRVISSPGNIIFTGTGSPITVTGLINGISYTFTVIAKNAVGTGATSSASNAIIPITVPTEPTSVAALAGSGEAIISFDMPTTSGGSDILYYIVSANTGGASITGSGSPITITGLTNGAFYAFTVVAVNAAGSSPSSSLSNSVTPITVPNAPTNISATGGNGQATVQFSGSTDNGGAPILYYIVMSDTGDIVVTGAGAPILITGLTNGVTYTFTVAAFNAAGTGEISSASNPMVPVTIPNAPTNVSATAGNGQATVQFSGSTDNGGTGIIYYIVRSSPGNRIVTGTDSPLTVTGLTNGVTYTFTVAARNGVGTGASGLSNSVIPVTLPSAPTSIVATGSSGQAIISFVPPANGGSAITEYIVTSSPGNIIVTGSSSPITVTGLTNGVSYVFSVAAKNGVGTGTSGFSNAVIPATVPIAPTNVSATGGNAQAVISFSGSTNSGGSAIIEYIVTSSPGNISFTGTGSPITVTGLTNGVTYTFTVAARNGAGTGALSSASNSVTPLTVPGVPTNIQGAGTDEVITIIFDAPATSGGSALLEYRLRSHTGALIMTGGSPMTLTGLIDGETYTYTVSAVNAQGEGASGAVTVTITTPTTKPSAPINISAVGGSGSATLAFSGPVDNGGLIINYYTVRSTTGLLLMTGVASPITVSGLMNGTTYTFLLGAVNTKGEGPTGSVSVMPVSVPNVPTSVSATGGDRQAIISFTPSTYDGGSAITHYIVTSSPGNISFTGTGSPITVTGLTNGVSYTFTVAAKNSAGTGPVSSLSNSVTPNIVISTVSVTAGVSGAAFNWTTNGALSTRVQYSISTGYTLSSTEKDIVTRVTSHNENISGLLACTTYNYRVSGSDSDGNRYTGNNATFTTLGCANNAMVLAQHDEMIFVPIGGTFSMTSDVGTVLELIIPIEIVTTSSELVFQGKQLEASTAIGAIGKPASDLTQVGALYDLQAYSGDTARVTLFDESLTITLSYRSQDIIGVDESTLAIYSHNGTSWSELDNCVIDTVNKTVTCDTMHFSNFSIFGLTQTISTPSPGGGGGGNMGGGIILKKDVCPSGDYSLSYYDNTCSSAGLPNLSSDILRLALTKCSSLNGEEQQSYCFNRAVGSTTMPTFMQARYYDQITRAQLSKIMGEFAKNILGKTIDKTKQCVFQGADPDGLKTYMIQACQLGLMNMTRPNDILTRGEYMTVLSRMLYGKTYEQTNVESEEHPFYEYHMEKLYSEGLIKIKEPMVKAQRFAPFLTLYRLAQKLDKERR